MPQLDTATYRGQVTWLRIVFGVFYTRRVKDILPRRNRAMKFRVRKVRHSRNSVGAYEGMRGNVERAYGKRMGGVSKSRRGRRQEERTKAGTWVADQRKTVREGTRSRPVTQARQTQVQPELSGLGWSAREARVSPARGGVKAVKRAKGKVNVRGTKTGGRKAAFIKTAGVAGAAGDAKAKTSPKRGKK